MTIGDFCKACGSRLGDIDHGYCGAKACQDYARTVAMAKGHLAMNTGDPRKVVHKDQLLANIDADLKGLDGGLHGPSDVLLHRGVLLKLRAAVVKYPWDDVTNLAALREGDLRVPSMSAPRTEQLEAERRVHGGPKCRWCGELVASRTKCLMHGHPLMKSMQDGSPFCPGCHLTHEMCKCRKLDVDAFKSDLTRLALAKPVETARMSVFDFGRQHSGSLHGEEWLTTIRGRMSHEDYAKLTVNGEIEFVIRPGHPGSVQLFEVPTNKQRVTTKEEVDLAIAGNGVKKRHVDVAEGAQLGMIAAMFIAGNFSRCFVGAILESDENYRKRIKAAMPLERGDEYVERGAFGGGRRAVQGVFDASMGMHLDTVAELNGLKRKGGETDESLRDRLYKTVEC